MSLDAANTIIMSRFARTEVLVAPDRQDWFEACFKAVAANEHAAEMLQFDLAAVDNFWPAADDWRASYRPYIVEKGVLKIPVMGVLLNRFGYALGRYATGYTYIQKALERGLEDSDVKGIAFVCDSPGGEVAGCFELADKIFESRGEKPLRAFSADHAYSAAYALSSSSSHLSVSRSGGVGSVGVVTSHISLEKALDKFGLKVTFIFAGKHKVDGNPYQNLPKAVKDRIQVRIDKTYGVFCAAVSRNRDMSEQAVRDTEALTYQADDAIEVGFADKVGIFEEELLAFQDGLSEDEPGDDFMATANTQGQNQDTAASVPLAVHTKAVEDAKTEGTKAGSTAERGRINGILGCENAKDRPKAALAAALDTDMTVEQANGFLGKLAVETVEPPKAEEQKPGTKAGNAFETAMNTSDNPNVGAGSGDKGKGGQADDESSLILQAYGHASGYKPKQEKAA